MNRLDQKTAHQALRANRVRTRIQGTAERPRLSVHISNYHVSAQLIDDVASKTVVAVTTVGKKEVSGNLTDKATWVGQQIAEAAQKAKLTSVVFDRGAKLYHGRVKALAEAAREKGLKF